MKKITIAIFLLSASIAYAAPQDVILREVKAEKKVKDAVWTQPTILKVGLISDGTDRSGYAAYICSIVEDNGMSGKGVVVQVIDIVKLKSSGKWEKMGEARCR